MPLVAQIAGGAALIAALTMPQWSDVPPAAPATPPTPPQSEPTTPVEPPARPAHLNLDLRHTFRRVDLSVTVDDTRVLATRIEGGGRKFGMFGRREERGFTRTLDLEPGVRVVRVRVQSPADKYDQSRVERFELGSAAVATMRVTAETSGLTVVTETPAAAPAPAPPRPAAAPVPRAAVAGVLYQTLRSLLIALAGFIASTAAAFVIEEFLRSRRQMIFAEEAQAAAAAAPRQRRPRKSRDAGATS